MAEGVFDGEAIYWRYGDDGSGEMEPFLPFDEKTAVFRPIIGFDLLPWEEVGVDHEPVLTYLKAAHARAKHHRQETGPHKYHSRGRVSESHQNQKAEKLQHRKER